MRIHNQAAELGRWRGCTRPLYSAALAVTFALMLTATARGHSDSSHQVARLTPAQLTKCGNRGKPVTLRRLVRVFRAHGISLTITEPTCFASEAKRRAGAPTDASNGGPSGLTISNAVQRKQGDVLCSVLSKTAATNRVYITKYPTDQETYVDTLNVDCAVYPFNKASEQRQVGALRRAMAALAATTKNGR